MNYKFEVKMSEGESKSYRMNGMTTLPLSINTLISIDNGKMTVKC